jgi:hypothetical protein
MVSYHVRTCRARSWGSTFQKAISEICGAKLGPSIITMTGEFVRILLQNEKRKAQLLKISEILNMQVVVTVPWSLQKTLDAAVAPVSADPDNDIA